MLRELAVGVYLSFFRIVFSFCNLFQTKNKTTFVTSFGANTKNVVKAHQKLLGNDQQIVVLQTPDSTEDFEHVAGTVLEFQIKKIVAFMKSIYHLATSSHVFVDNYFGFLAAATFKKDVTCIQLWHAAGAIKKFGLEDQTNQFRSRKALQRFEDVYEQFHKVVVGSEPMADIFKRSFGLGEERFLKTGVPRTDFFFDTVKMEQARQRISTDFPIIQHKKVLLYAPTYRDEELNTAAIALDLEKMYRALSQEYIVFLRLHPAVSSEFENEFPGFVFNVSYYSNINDLLVAADILITDYSSIPVEFSLLHRPMIFHAYDLDAYIEKRGIWMEDFSEVPGPVVTSTTELIETIERENFNMDVVAAFRNEWNQYSDGDSSERLIHTLFSTKNRSLS